MAKGYNIEEFSLTFSWNRFIKGTFLRGKARKVTDIKINENLEMENEEIAFSLDQVANAGSTVLLNNTGFVQVYPDTKRPKRNGYVAYNMTVITIIVILNLCRYSSIEIHA